MDKEDLFNRTTGLILNVHELETALTKDLDIKNVTSLQLNILKILYLSNSKNLSDLSSCLNINLPNCSREIKKLTINGYVTKRSSDNDKRITEITLTELGRDMVYNILNKMKESYFKNKSDLSDEMVEECIKSINTLQKYLF